MIRLLLRKSWRESQWLLLSCAAAIFIFCWLRVWIVSRLSTDRFRAILEMLPGDWRRYLSIDFEWLITYPGRISMAYQELIVVLGVLVWSIARGSDVVSGELNRGTMEMLLAQPLSRRSILATQTVVATVGVAALALAAWAGTTAGLYTTTVKEEMAPSVKLPLYLPGFGTEISLPFAEKKTRLVPMHEKVEASTFVPASINLFAFGVMAVGLSMLMSSFDRYRWRSIGLVSGVLIAQMLLKVAGMALESWEWLKYLSLMTAYQPEVHVRMISTQTSSVWSVWLVDPATRQAGLGPLGDNLLLLAVGALAIGLAGVVFSRRDLPAPL